MVPRTLGNVSMLLMHSKFMELQVSESDVFLRKVGTRKQDIAVDAPSCVINFCDPALSSSRQAQLPRVGE